MSRSFRRTPIVGNVRSRSERLDKKRSAKRDRVVSLGEDSLAPVAAKQSRTHGFAKDGRNFIDLAKTAARVAEAKGISLARATRRLMGK